MSGPVSISLARFLGLLTRELHGAVATLADDDVESGPAALIETLPDGRRIVVRFDAPPPDRETLQERLATLVATFGDGVATDIDEARDRPRSIALALHDELRDLANRAGALDAFVIDAHSPVVWGSANVRHPDGALVRTQAVDAALAFAERTRHELLETIRQESVPPGTGQDTTAEDSVFPPGMDNGVGALKDATQRALRHLRAEPHLEQLHRGKPLRESHLEDGLGYLAHSFAAIYLLVVVYDGAFDELRAERAMHDGLPRIERLVLALPPLEPEPQPSAGVVRLSQRRRR